MPGGDRTGPLGQGPMTGRGTGYCGGASGPGFFGRWFGRAAGRGGGRGAGRGWRNIFHATGLTGWQRAEAGVDSPAEEAANVTATQELELLKRQADSAAAMLEQIRKRIDELQDPKVED